MGFNSVKAMVDAELSGQSKYSTWRKTPTQTTAQGIWFDLSMSPGNPVPQYYAATPLYSVVLAQSTDGGIFHGASPGGGSLKFLRRLMAMTVTAAAVPLPMILCDYLLFYPTVDEGVLDPQTLVTNAPLTRYTSGEGVRMMAVVTGLQGGGQPFTVTYTNSNGQSGRTTPAITMNAQGAVGTLISTAQATPGCVGPFLPLQRGDTGVRSIDGVQIGGIGDYGLMTLVLVKPLENMVIRGIDAPTEIDYWTDFASAPRIYDDAYLNFICQPNGTLAAAPIHGDALFVWG